MKVIVESIILYRFYTIDYSLSFNLNINYICHIVGKYLSYTFRNRKFINLAENALLNLSKYKYLLSEYYIYYND